MNPPVPLQAFLTRLIWLCVVPLLLLSSWLALDSVRSSRASRDAQASHLAQNFATAIDQYLDARIGALGMLAASPLASNAVRRAEFYQEAQGFAQHFGSHVLLADPAMQMLFNTRVPLGTALPLLPPSQGRAAAPQVLETGAPAVGDVVLGPIAGVPLVAIAVPGKRHGKTEFLLLTTLEARQFQERLAQVALPSGWALTLRDGTGATIARRAPTGFDAGREADGTGRFVVQSGRSPWSVLLEIPRQSYQAPLFTAAAVLVLLIFGATLVGVAGGTLAGRRLGRAMAGLTSPAAPDAGSPAIAEIAAVRGALDAAAQQRASAEAALQYSERRFRLAASTGNVWDWDVSSREVSFPAEFWRGLGHAQAPIEEPTAMFESMLHPQDLPRWRQALQDHIDHHLPFDLDYRIRENSRGYRWFNTRGQAQWEDGRATYMAGTTFDISARKLAEQKIRDQIEVLTRREAESRELLATSTQARRALLGVLEDQARADAARRVSEQKLHLMLDAANIGHWDIDLVTHAAYHSLKHDQIFGYEELQSDWTYDRFLAHVHPDDRALVERLFRAGATAKTAWDFECRITRHDGELRWIWVHGNVFTNSAGRTERAAGMVRDITERKLAEDAVRESEARYRTLFEYAPDGIVIFSDAAERHLIDVNASLCQMLGYTRDELIKLRPADIVAPAEITQIAPAISAIKTEPAYYRTWQFQRKDVSIFTAEVIATPMPDGNLLALIRDITERKRAEEALAESRARLEAMTRRLLEVQEAERRMVARELHDEVGSVLTAVKLNLQALRRAHSAAQREAALADGLALVEGAIQSVRSLSLDLRPSMLDDLGLIPALKWYCERQAQRAGVVIELSLDAIDLKGAAQLETACFRIVQEALTNALRHAQAKCIEVALRRGEGNFVLEVIDDGVGFEALAARARGLAGESGGLLGMAERANLLGGRFGVDSGPGGGTRVWAEFAMPEGGFS